MRYCETDVWRSMKKPTYAFRDLFSDFDGLVLTTRAWEWFLSAVQDDKSPGLPLAYRFSCNGDVKKNFSLELKKRVEVRLRKLACLGRRFWECGRAPSTVAFRVFLIGSGYVDPVRVFAKNEPHKATKPGRNISSVSLVDSLVERILYSSVLAAQVESWKETSITIGIDLDTPSETKEFYNRVTSTLTGGVKMVSDDVQGFEWHYDGVSESVFMHNMIKLNGEAPNQESVFSCIAAGRSLCALQPLYVLSNGTVLATSSPNQLSGRFVTTLANSVDRLDRRDRARLAICRTSFGEEKAREAYDEWTAKDRVFVNGDDALEDAFSGQEVFEAAYGSAGLKVTDYMEFTQGENFVYCSHVFTPSGAYPENPAKLVAKFLMGSRNADQLSALRKSLARVPGGIWSEKLDLFLRA